MEWLTVGEAAHYLKVNPRTVSRCARENKIPAHRLSGGTHRATWRFTRAELDDMLWSSSAVTADGDSNEASTTPHNGLRALRQKAQDLELPLVRRHHPSFQTYRYQAGIPNQGRGPEGYRKPSEGVTAEGLGEWKYSAKCCGTVYGGAYAFSPFNGASVSLVPEESHPAEVGRRRHQDRAAPPGRDIAP